MVPGRAAPNSVPDIGPAAGCTSAICTHGGGEMINFTLNNSLTFRHTAAHTHWRPCLFCQGGYFVHPCLLFIFPPTVGLLVFHHSLTGGYLTRAEHYFLSRVASGSSHQAPINNGHNINYSSDSVVHGAQYSTVYSTVLCTVR